jgi:hypothetical protein
LKLADAVVGPREVCSPRRSSLGVELLLFSEAIFMESPSRELPGTTRAKKILERAESLKFQLPAPSG